MEDKEKKKVRGDIATRFQPGNTMGKGHGRPKMTPEQKAMAITTRTQFKTLLSQYMTLTLDEVKLHLSQKKLPAIDMAVLKHLENMIESGSMDRVDWTADHIMGAKPKQSEVTVIAKNKVDTSKLSAEQLKQLKAIQETLNGE